VQTRSAVVQSSRQHDGESRARRTPRKPNGTADRSRGGCGARAPRSSAACVRLRR
jgi:hypothetical protein